MEAPEHVFLVGEDEISLFFLSWEGLFSEPMSVSSTEGNVFLKNPPPTGLFPRGFF